MCIKVGGSDGKSRDSIFTVLVMVLGLGITVLVLVLGLGITVLVLVSEGTALVLVLVSRVVSWS